MKRTAPHPTPATDFDRERWLDGIVPLAEGARLISVSVDTLKRAAVKGRYRLIRVGERKLGVRRRDVLGL
jgi:hypothetical protein